MGNTRRFNPSRRQKVLSLKERNKALEAQNGYLSGQIAATSALLAATNMERPPDLDEWVSQAVVDMDADERAVWEAMDADEQAEFVDELGKRINAAQALVHGLDGQEPQVAEAQPEAEHA